MLSRADSPSAAYAWFGHSRPKRDADDDRHDDPGDQRPADPAARDPDRGKTGRDGDRGEREDPVEHAPAHRSEQPLPEEQGDPDDGEQAGQDDDDDGDRHERRDPSDLAGDRAHLGLRQVDMRLDERDGRVACREQLRPEAAGRLVRVAWTRGAVGSTDRPG